MLKLSLNDKSLLRESAHIGGEWVTGEPESSYTLISPATGEIIAELPRFRAGETRETITLAHRAFLTWSKNTAKHRSEILYRWYLLMVENREDIAQIISFEEGKPIRESLGEVDYAASFIQWFAEEAKRVRGEVIPSPRDGQRIVVLKEPVGVCAAITPWNFPAAMITRKAAPALAAGCTMVVKPARQTPLTALALAELAKRAGVPAGVFNVITGSDAREIGFELTTNPLVRKVTFTGSTEVGRVLLAQSAATIKKCSMELGGNAPFIVFEDADIDSAVEGVLAAKFRNTGQSCIGANRVLVHTAVYDSFALKLAPRVAALKVAIGSDEASEVGPLIDAGAVAKVEEHVSDALSRGATLLTGGRRHELGGNFYEPTVLAGVNSSMLIANEETFGPVLPLLRFDSEEEAIHIANDTEMGLASYLYSRDHARIWRVAAALESGMVGINCGIISTEVAPFGGVKQSGIGREGSQHGIDEFLEMKYLSWDGLDR